MGAKQIFTVCLFLLANIMLQVHTFIPHHHHNGQVCFDGYQQNFGASADGNDVQNSSAHNTNEDSECCVLKHDYLIPDDGFDYKPAVTIVHHGFHLTISLITAGVTFSPQEFAARLHWSYACKLQSFTFLSESGQRSPPACSLFWFNLSQPV